MLNLIAAAFLATGASAPEASVAAPETAQDPQRKICETYQETGSRLGKKRICLTAEQWQDRRRADRGEIERSQQNVGQPSGQ